MLKTEFKAVTKQWIMSKGFKKDGDVWYAYPLAEFDVNFVFYKNRFDEWFSIAVGFQLREVDTGWGKTGIEVPKKYWHHYETADGAKHISKGAIYYDKWSKEDYLNYLEDVYKIYITPYIEKGVKHLKAMVKQDKYSMIHPDAVKIIEKM